MSNTVIQCSDTCAITKGIAGCRANAATCNEDLSSVRLVKRGTFPHSWRKYLFSTFDGFFEASAVKQVQGWSLGISSQVGCPIGCVFCATGKGGFTRNLSSAELVSQMKLLMADVPESVHEIRFDGQGEPLLNLEAVQEAWRVVGNTEIVVSTCGVPEGIRQFTQLYGGKSRLRVTLHTVDQEIRNQLMPGAAQWPLEDLARALEIWSDEHPNKLQLEWGLLPGVNDRKKDLLAAARFADRVGASLRLSVLTEIGSLQQHTSQQSIPSPQDLLLCAKAYLEEAGVPVVVQEPYPESPISVKWYKNNK